MDRPTSISYTKSNWATFIEKVTFLYRQGNSISHIAKELNLPDTLIEMTIRTQINRSHCPK